MRDWCEDYDYKNSKEEVLNELENKLRIWDNNVNAIPNYVWKCIKEMRGDTEKQCKHIQ